MQEQNGIWDEPASRSTFSCNVSLDNTSSTFILAMIGRCGHKDPAVIERICCPLALPSFQDLGASCLPLNSVKFLGQPFHLTSPS